MHRLIQLIALFSLNFSFFTAKAKYLVNAFLTFLVFSYIPKRNSIQKQHLNPFRFPSVTESADSSDVSS